VHVVPSVSFHCPHVTITKTVHSPTETKVETKVETTEAPAAADPAPAPAPEEQAESAAPVVETKVETHEEPKVTVETRITTVEPSHIVLTRPVKTVTTTTETTTTTTVTKAPVWTSTCLWRHGPAHFYELHGFEHNRIP